MEVADSRVSIQNNLAVGLCWCLTALLRRVILKGRGGPAWCWASRPYLLWRSAAARQHVPGALRCWHGARSI